MGSLSGKFPLFLITFGYLLGHSWTIFGSLAGSLPGFCGALWGSLPGHFWIMLGSLPAHVWVTCPDFGCSKRFFRYFDFSSHRKIRLIPVVLTFRCASPGVYNSSGWLARCEDRWNLKFGSRLRFAHISYIPLTPIAELAGAIYMTSLAQLPVALKIKIARSRPLA